MFLALRIAPFNGQNSTSRSVTMR